jgi:peptidoglycan/LPS O-acetylase OafA/YrhL
MMLEKPQNKTKSRMHSLDGLRGVAALIVVIHHLLLTLPWFADRVGLGQLGAKGQFTFSWHNFFEYTPLHILYGGTEAVVIFFVLSGFVLVNSVDKQSLVTYTRNRLVRLYAPIIAAVILAGGLLKVIPHQKMDGASWWLNSHAVPFTFVALFRNMWVLDGADWLNSSLWSMRYEVFFSLSVMVFAGFVFIKSTSQFIRAMIIVVVAIWIGMHFGLDLLSWLPVFFAGSALHWLDEDKFLSSGLKVIIGWFVMFVPWYFAGFGYSLSTSLSRICMTLGAVLIVDACRNQGSVVSKVLSTRPFKLAGRYSYSLYLVHAPILTSVWFVMGVTESHIGWLLRAGISILFIGLGTALVFTLAEKPSLKWIHARS